MGKTKDVQVLGNGRIRFHFKDDATGTKDGFDPGANQIFGQIQDKAFVALWISDHFFKLMVREGIPNHHLSSDFEKLEMDVLQAEMIPFEFIYRCFSYGSFCRRYGVDEMIPLNITEITLKDDNLGDPLINEEAIYALGWISDDNLDECMCLTDQIAQIVGEDLAEKGLELIDIKFEFGIVETEEGEKVILVDEISPDTMRVMAPDGHILSPKELGEIMMEE